MALADWDRNLFTSDPTMFERARDEEYERAANALGALGDPTRLRLLHALAVGENTVQRAALWCGLSQAIAERELAALAEIGLVEHRADGSNTYLLVDGHYVVQLHVALAHGREGPVRHPRLLARRRVSSRSRVG